MTCVSINSTTTTSGTPSNQRMTGIFVSFFQLHQQFLGQKIVPSICARWATPKDVCLGPMADNLSLRKITLMSDLKNERIPEEPDMHRAEETKAQLRGCELSDNRSAIPCRRTWATGPGSASSSEFTS